MATQNKSILQIINNGKQYPVISLVKQSPVLAATISKLIQPFEKEVLDQNGNRRLDNVDKHNFTNISKDVADKTADAESTMQLFPDMELGAQILISSIISPKDMTSTEIIYTSPNSILSSEVNSGLITKVKEYFSTDYNLVGLLPTILRQILFEAGSYPVAVIPESSVDELINNKNKITLESLSTHVDAKGELKPFGILGDPRNKGKDKTFASLESFFQKTDNTNYDSLLTTKDSAGNFAAMEGCNVRVIDNPFALKLPKILKGIRLQQIKDIFSTSNVKNSIAFENNFKELNDEQLINLIYKNKTRQVEEFVKVKTKEQTRRASVGKPLILKLPPESVIPVTVPGNPKDHIGYFVLIDVDGNPINKMTSKHNFNELQTKLSSGSTSMSSFLQTKAAHGINGNDSNRNNLTMAQGAKVYADIIETDLLERLRTGVYGSNVSIAHNEDIYQIMLARALANQMTQILYLPAELVTYFAYKYSPNGIGKSLLDDMRVLNSLRAMMLFSRIMASVKNSIGRTQVKLKLDERDPDPQKSIETMIHEIGKTRQQYFPLGINAPTDLVDWIQRSGLEFTFEGHPKIPDMNVEFSENASNYPKPDTDLDEDLKKRSIMGIGLSPETVDNGFNSEFATTVVANNILLSKRVLQIQEHIEPLLTDHASKIVMNDGDLMSQLKAIIKENYNKLQNSISEVDKEKLHDKTDEEEIIKFLLNDFIEHLKLGLPKPNTVTLESQMTAFDVYTEALDKGIEAWINTNIINTNMSGGMSDNIDNIKAIIKAYYLRKWMADNNVLTELAELTTKGDDGKPLFNIIEIQKDHINGLLASSVHLLQSTKPMGDAADKDLTNITGSSELEASATSSAPDSSSGGDSGSDFGGGGDFGMGDMGFDDIGGEPPVEGGDETTGEPPADGGDDTIGDDSTKKKEDLPNLDDLPE